jgi:UDP-galactopyranose mutase
MKKVLIIGGGFAGCTTAHQINLLEKKYEVTLIEKGNFRCAGVRTSWYGGHPYTFGPRHFLTPHEKVYEFLNKYLPLRKCPEHEAWTYVERDGEFYNFPIHKDDIERMPDKEKIKNEIKNANGVENSKNLEEYWINSVGKTLYEKFVLEYNKKMWRISDNKIHDTFNWSAKGVALKEGKRAFWSEWISAYPYNSNGYDDYFEIATKGTNVLLNTSIDNYEIEKKRVFYSGEWHSYDIIVNTISPDILFNKCFGELPYTGLDLQLLVLPMEFCFPKNVYFLYYANKEPFKRLVEYKKFTHHQSNTTLLGIEIPSANGKYYPMPIMSEKNKAKKYLDLFPSNTFSIGRSGSYEYLVDIDDCIFQAMSVCEQL